MLKFHSITNEEKYLISQWKYENEYSIYNNIPYDEQIKLNKGFANPKNNFYSFYDNNILVGYTNLIKKDKEVFLGVGVNPNYLNQGYGTKITKMACSISKELYKNKPLYLEVRTWNKRAIKCYQNAGFIIDGEEFIKTTPIGKGTFYRMIKE